MLEFEGHCYWLCSVRSKSKKLGETAVLEFWTLSRCSFSIYYWIPTAFPSSDRWSNRPTRILSFINSGIIQSARHKYVAARFTLMHAHTYTFISRCDVIRIDSSLLICVCWGKAGARAPRSNYWEGDKSWRESFPDEMAAAETQVRYWKPLPWL